MTTFDELHFETKEDSASIQTRMILANGVKAGMWIHHTLTAAGAGWYEVVGVKERFDGWTSIQVNCMSRSGKPFTSSLLYRPGSKVEVSPIRASVQVK